MEQTFFELLHADAAFRDALGGMTLAVARFESNARVFLASRGCVLAPKRATFDRLITELRRRELLSDNGVSVLNVLKQQRNYLVHSLYDLFTGRINETLLPRTDLVPMDVIGFTERVRQLEHDLLALSRIAEKEMAAIPSSDDNPRLLLRP